MSTVCDAYEERKRAEVMADAWGHLFPKPRLKYPGWIKVVHTAWAETSLFDSDFGDLPSSPILFDHMGDWLFKLPSLDTGLYRWKGWYMLYNNGRCHFSSAALEKLY